MLQEQVVQENEVEVKGRRPLSRLWDAVLAGSGIVAYMPILVVAMLLFYGASWQIFGLTTDATRYQCYGLAFWLGGGAVKLRPFLQCNFFPPETLTLPPFHTLPLEYPPLTLLPFSLGLFAPLPYYQVLFALWMALVAVLIYWLLLRFGPHGAGLTFAVYALLGGWATAEGRFDLIPAALTLLCVIAAERKRWTLAYITLAFAVLLKTYPLLLFPVLFIAEQYDAQRLCIPLSSTTIKGLFAELRHALDGAWNWRWKNSLLFSGVLLGVTGAFALVDFRGTMGNELSYFAGRPVQIEATGSTFLWLAGSLGFPVHAEFSFGSLNVVSTLDGVVSLMFAVFFVLGYAYVLWMQWRGKLDIVQASIAILLVFVATGKVFSPQYLIWIMALLAYSNAFDRFWLLCWGGISLLTTAIYPYLYTRIAHVLLVPSVPGFIETIAVRNILFVLVTLAYLFNWFQVRRRNPTTGHTVPQTASARVRPYSSGSLLISIIGKMGSGL